MTDLARFEDLVRTVNDMQQQLSEYVIAQKKATSTLHANHKEQLAALDDKARGLQQCYVDLEKDEKHAIKGQQQRRCELDAVRGAVHEARDMQQQAELHTQSLEMQVTLLENQKLQLHQQINELQRVHQKCSNEVTKGLTFFSDRLGLQFERIGEDGLRFKFTQIDPDSPERAFFFSVIIDKEGVYHVDDVAPPVEDLDVLIDTLNATNDFAGFVRAIRRLFRNLCF